MSRGVHSANPRVRGIRVADHGCGACSICGKKTAKRQGKAPAPINIVLEFAAVAFKNNFSHDNERIAPGPAQIGVPRCLADTGWELGRALRIGGALCLACAKRLSSRLDAVIDQIEAEYRASPEP
jgi:hypothetical protein